MLPREKSEYITVVEAEEPSNLKIFTLYFNDDRLIASMKLRNTQYQSWVVGNSISLNYGSH